MITIKVKSERKIYEKKILIENFLSFQKSGFRIKMYSCLSELVPEPVPHFYQTLRQKFSKT